MQYKKNYTILIGVLGTVFEWLEYSYYGYITTLISCLFFPKSDPRVAMIATMGIFAAGFLMRPIGGVIFGYLGDKKGRKIALFLSLFMMGCATLLMGLLPTYAQIGLLAPLLLLLCRLLQGLAVSGEFNGAAIFLIEHSKNNYPTLAGSWVAMASALGMLLGALSATIISKPGMPEWAWRVPFLFSFCSCLIASYLRYRLLESPLFLTAKQQQQIIRFPLKEVLQHYLGAFITTLLLAALVSVCVYVCNVFYVTFLIQTAHLPIPSATKAAALGELTVVICVPIAAMLAEYFGHRKVMLLGLVLMLITTPLVFWSGVQESLVLIMFGQICYGVANAFAFAPIFYFIYKLFPTSIRYTGNSTAWSLGVALFGSTAPIVANYLLQFDMVLGPSLLVYIFIALAFWIVIRRKFEDYLLKSDGLLRNSY